MLIGARLGPYEILAPLGSGGMGEVYRARDTRLRREVALKVLPEELGRDPERLARFEREARAVAALNHPNIVTVFSVDEAAGVRFITMEVVEGRTLRELIPEHAMPVGTLLQVAIPLADALASAHARGVIHGDYTHREFKDTYETRVDMGTGQVELEALGVNWGSLDLGTIQNSSYSRRTYDGISLQGDYRVGDRLRLGGNYTWSHAYGNFSLSDAYGGVPLSSSNNPSFYPEYRDVSWSNPKGDLTIDQRHRARAWTVWDLLSTAHNRLSASILQSYGSGTPYSAVGAVFSRLYVTNPGYVNPPYSVPYFYSRRGEYTTPATFPTDLALNYSFVFRALGADLEIFVQPEVTNVFNQARPISVNTTVRDATFFSATFVSFNPRTTAPLECPQGASATECRTMGANWQEGPNFGKPTTPDQYQTPRTFRISAGVRF